MNISLRRLRDSLVFFFEPKKRLLTLLKALKEQSTLPNSTPHHQPQRLRNHNISHIESKPMPLEACISSKDKFTIHIRNINKKPRRNSPKTQIPYSSFQRNCISTPKYLPRIAFKWSQNATGFDAVSEYANRLHSRLRGPPLTDNTDRRTHGQVPKAPRPSARINELPNNSNKNKIPNTKNEKEEEMRNIIFNSNNIFDTTMRNFVYATSFHKFIRIVFIIVVHTRTRPQAHGANALALAALVVQVQC